MRVRPMRSILFLLMAALGLTTSAYSAPPSSASITKIFTLPFNITTSGTYVLSGNFYFPTLSSAAAGIIPAISIANNVKGAVVLDFKGFTITGGGELKLNAVSVGVAIGTGDTPATNAFPIIIRNGGLTNFTIGVEASQGGHAGLTNITLDHLTVSHPVSAVTQTTAL